MSTGAAKPLDVLARALDQTTRVLGEVPAPESFTDLDAEVRKWADEILALSPTVIKIVKKSFDEEYRPLREEQDARGVGRGVAAHRVVEPDRLAQVAPPVERVAVLAGHGARPQFKFARGIGLCKSRELRMEERYLRSLHRTAIHRHCSCHGHRFGTAAGFTAADKQDTFTITISDGVPFNVRSH